MEEGVDVEVVKGLDQGQETKDERGHWDGGQTRHSAQTILHV